MIKTRYALVLTLIGGAQIVLAVEAARLWPLAWMLAWSGISWVMVGCGYAFLGPRVFGKRQSGQLAWYSYLFLLPYHSINGLVWLAQTRLTREACHNEIATGIWLGRRCGARELPGEVRTVVDLTAEFGESAAVRNGRAYICVPTLDAAIPAAGELQDLIQSLAGCSERLYIHCAVGHGRSATIAIALLVAKGLAKTLEEAEQMVRAAQPGIKINSLQRRALEEWFAARTPIAHQQSNTDQQMPFRNR